MFILVGMMTQANAQAVQTCIGPKVDQVVPGDWKHGVPDRFVGPTPDVLMGPGGRPTVKRLPAGGAYLADRIAPGFYHLTGTRFSPPYAAGVAVGWVNSRDFQGLALRNCN